MEIMKSKHQKEYEECQDQNNPGWREIHTYNKKKSMKGKSARKDYSPEEIAYMKFIGLKIKKRRVQLGMTQTDVGKMILTSFQQVQKYEKGKNIINNIKMERIRQALNIPQYRIGFLMNKYNKKYDNKSKA